MKFRAIHIFFGGEGGDGGMLRRKNDHQCNDKK